MLPLYQDPLSPPPLFLPLPLSCPPTPSVRPHLHPSHKPPNPRAEQEAAERRRTEAAEALAQRRAAAAASLPPEPAPGTPTPCAVIRVRLPDGSNHQRRFESVAAVSAVYDWVNSLENCTFMRYSLVCNFPRRVYGGESMGASLQDAGLAPQGVLFVQVEDDPEDEGTGGPGGSGGSAAGAGGSGAR